MQICFISFTKKGMELSGKIGKNLTVISESKGESGLDITLYTKFDSFDADFSSDVNYVNQSLYELVDGIMSQRKAVVFVGAVGIAVRLIAPSIKNKLNDSPVIVVDELGKYVIPLLSGHFGGANLLAEEIAGAIGAASVITTATDIEGAFAADMFAKDNNLTILNKDRIKNASAKSLEGKPVRISIENFPPRDCDCDVVIGTDTTDYINRALCLCPKKYGIGIGCRKNTDCEKLHDFVLKALQEQGISIEEVGAVGSVKLKEDEPSIISLSNRYRLPFITFTSEILKEAKGEYEESEFVEGITGIGNVCERAAMMLTGNRGTIILKKKVKDGMTLSISKTGY